MSTGNFPCPQCRCDTSVIDSRPSSFRENHAVRRRRACTKCDHRFTTHELSTDVLKAKPSFGEEVLKMTIDYLETMRNLVRNHDHLS